MVMNRIGFTLLFLGTFLFLSTSCQNFFWSHRCCDTVVPPQTEYGYLYNWWAAIGDTDGDNVSNTSIANEGWHVPTTEDFYNLFQEIEPGGSVFSNTAASHLKETGTIYWTVDSGTDNSTGFSARGTGHRDYTSGGSFSSRKSNLFMWNSTEYDATRGKISSMEASSNVFTTSEYPSGATYLDPKQDGAAIYLIKDDSNWNLGDMYIGNNNIAYPTVKIGNQVWLAKALEETKYRNGTNIPLIGNSEPDNIVWNALTTGAYCTYSIP
jgi:uncharacterized protein (TIGR02145 family)